MTNREKFDELLSALSDANPPAFYEAMYEQTPISFRDRYGCNHEKKFKEIDEVLSKEGLEAASALMKRVWNIRNHLFDRKMVGGLNSVIDCIDEHIEAIAESGLIGYIPADVDCESENCVKILKEKREKLYKILDPILAMLRSYYQIIEDCNLEQERNALYALIRPMTVVSFTAAKVLNEYDEVAEGSNKEEEEFLLNLIGTYLKLLPVLTPTLKTISVVLYSMKETLEGVKALQSFQEEFVGVYNEMLKDYKASEEKDKEKEEK